MPASKQLKVLSVRLPEPELRRFKSLAATRGVSVQRAVHEALEAWALTPPKRLPEPLNALQGSLVGVDTEKLLREEKQAELAKDQRWS